MSTPEDVAIVAQYAKTYADGTVWEAACRLLAALRAGQAGSPQPGQRVTADLALEWTLYEGCDR